MLKFSANLSMLYPELGFTERFGAAARDRFQGVEYVGPYDFPSDQIAGLLEANGLEQALFNSPAGNWAAGERGIACLPDRVDEFREGISRAIEYARSLRCTRVNVLAGLAPADADRSLLEDTLVANLAYAAPRMEEAGIKLLVEPINLRDSPAYFLSTSRDAERVLDRVGSNNLFIQYDFYHMQVMQGDLVRTFERLQHCIAHVQIADNPGRHEPGTGEIDYGFILDALERLGYEGWVGCEYKPQAGAGAGVGWMHARMERKSFLGSSP